MASAVVALTLVYLSRPRPKNQAAENGNEPVSTKNRSGGNKSIFKDGNLFKRTSKRKAVDNKLQTETEPGGPENPGLVTAAIDAGEKSSPVNPEMKDEQKPEPDVPTFKEEEKPAPVKPETKDQEQPDAAPAPAPPSSLNMEKQATEVIQNVQPAVVPNAAAADVTATQVVTATPVITIVNEKGGSIQMEDKPKEASQNNDFSELFTDNDDEENEVSMLAKELQDLETEDILNDTRDLLNEIKKMKP